MQEGEDTVIFRSKRGTVQLYIECKGGRYSYIYIYRVQVGEGTAIYIYIECKRGKVQLYL